MRSLASLLDEQRLAAPDVAAHLQVSLASLKHRLPDATQWTNTDLARVADLTKWSVADLRTLHPFR